MRVKEFVLGMQGHPERIDRLVDAGVIGPKKQATKDYWKGLLASPDDPAWLNFVNALEVQTALNAAARTLTDSQVKAIISDTQVVAHLEP